MTAFLPCLKNLSEAKFESNRLISLVEEISEKHNIDYIDSAMLLIVITLIQVMM